MVPHDLQPHERVDQLKLMEEKRTYRRERHSEHAHPSQPLLLCSVPPSQHPIVCQGHASILSAKRKVSDEEIEKYRKADPYGAPPDITLL